MNDRRRSWLLFIYPPVLRREHGDEIALAVSQSWRDQRGVGRRLRLIAHVIGDGLRSWTRVTRSPMAPPPAPPPRRSASALADDVRSAVRLFRTSPVFAAGAVLTLAAGIGASAAIFSLADATLLRPLPIAEPERVVQLTWTSSHPDFRDMAASQRVFTDMAAWASRDLGVDVHGRTASVRTAMVSAGYFELAGQRAVAGRLLTDEDDRPGAPLAAVMSERLWRREFNADPRLVGSTLRINQRPVTLLGIVPRAFRGFTLAEVPELFLPLYTVAELSPDFAARQGVLDNRDIVFLQVAGRRAPGVTHEQAEADVDRLYRRLHPPRDPSEPPERLTLLPLLVRAAGLDTTSELRRFMIVLGAATAFTLLLACVTVASLLLVRAERRHRELGVRAALGAGRLRLARLLTAESLAIGIAGAALGTAIASMCLFVLGRFSLPGSIAIGDLDLTVHRTVLASSALLGLATTLVFGLAPLWTVTRIDAMSALRDGGRVSARQPLRATLVAAQVALCVVLLGGGLAFGRAVRQAFAIDFGYDTRHTAIVTVNPSLVRYTRDRTVGFQRDTLDRLRGVPWVSAAAWAAIRPLRGRMTAQMSAEGRPIVPARQRNLDANGVTDGYFEALGIPLLTGRTFEPTDTSSSPHVAVLSASAAAKLFPGEHAVGRRVTNDPESPSPRWTTIVGVVGDIKRGLERAPDPMIYMPLAQTLWLLDLGPVYLFVRSTERPAELTMQQTAALVRQVDPAMAITHTQTMREHVGAAAMAPRLGFTLFALFALLAVVLTTFGVYAVVAYAIARRTREIGIRLALGARAGGVLRLVMAQGLWPVLAGLIAGGVAFWWFSGTLSRFLLSVPPFDVWTLLAMTIGILTIAALAMLVPARRALSIDPAVTLRSE